MPNATIAWVLWHIEWWLADAISGVRGKPAVRHDLGQSGTLDTAALHTSAAGRGQQLVRRSPAVAPRRARFHLWSFS